MTKSKKTKYVLPKGKALGLRTCNEDMTSHGGFKWPTKGHVKCPDWQPTSQCGRGLHWLPWGEGNGSLLDFSEAAKWLVVEYDPKTAIDLGRKMKGPSCTVVFCGNRFDAMDFLKKYITQPRAIVGVTWNGGDNSTLTGGVRSTLNGGDWSTLNGGDSSTLTGGVWSTLNGGDSSTLTGGDNSTLTGGNWSTLNGGDWSTLNGGDNSTLNGGDNSTLTGGNWSKCKGGKGSIISIKWCDNSAERYRITTGYVGENGIRPNVFYCCDDNGKLVKVK